MVEKYFNKHKERKPENDRHIEEVSCNNKYRVLLVLLQYYVWLIWVADEMSFSSGWYVIAALYV